MDQEPVNPAPLLSAVNLNKRYRLPHKVVEVLKGAAIEVRAGERVAIVGRSGLEQVHLVVRHDR